MNSKKQAGIWIDSKKAIVVTLDQNDKQITVIPSNIEDKTHYENEGDKGSFMGQQHVSNERTFDERKKNQLHTFLQEVVASLKDVAGIYICGPAEVKVHLRKEVEANKNLEKVFRGIDSCEQMTENQLVAKVKKFYEQN
ncbi:MAG: hypothetical protein ABI315_01760 [Bacteroidia bacterium]